VQSEMSMIDISGYYRCIRDDGIAGWYNPVTKHFLIPVDKA